ncbi:MAG: carboxypeptidase regulatory-like domain-containing protein [Acidobacteria bacterium]|nr:carboxypeptidase regulatory-like domain-containing protein [Acidobacteriota bacterium]
MGNPRAIRTVFFIALFAICSFALMAQSTGGISGKVTTGDGDPLPGVTIEARSNVLPQARVSATQSNGDFRLPALPPGSYTVTFSLSGMQAQTRTVQVNLGQDATVNVRMALEALAETITVTASSSLIDPTSTAITSAVDEEVIQLVPTGQEYRDLLKLAPAVQYTEDTIRGPSAGGSGQDNVYQFDGVNVTLPLYGTLSAEPSSHDIDQVSVLKGGAKAVDFNRAAGFTVDSVSKSGTNEWSGSLQYQIQSSDMTADQDFNVTSVYDQDRAWATLGIGGPLVRDRLFFYGSYYRPTVDRDNASNAYGVVPNYESTRDEYFGKLTFTPTGNLLFHGSYRDSERTGENASIGGFETVSAGTNEESGQTIAILEGSWVIDNRSYASFKVNDYENRTSAVANTQLSATPSLNLGTSLDLDNLDQLGAFSVPSVRPGNDTFNTFIQPFLDRYGFIRDGVRTGGGLVGGDSTARDDIDFFRESYQIGYDISLGTDITHDLHFGFQQYTDAEELTRLSNGWGSITVPGGTANCPAGTECAGQPIFFQANFLRSSGVGAGVLKSEFESQNFEINDTIQWNDWSFNVGLVVSNDKLFGQGLRNDSSTASGYVLEPGSKYEMYEVPWGDQIQPRLGATWAYNGMDTVYASYAKYNPAVNSLPRAASWDRAVLGQLYRTYFNANGELIGTEAVGGSSGKLFVEDMDPRYTDEFLIGTARQINNELSARVYGRYRYSTNFWEDTNNTARVAYEPPAGIPREPYIGNLNDLRAQICASNPAVCGSGPYSGSTYVIATLDDAFTKYYEATVESDWRPVSNAFLRGTYTWSHYYGNFDQDNTTSNNDLSIFVGSSFIGDAAGRQIWDNKYGNLRADRRHLLKLYGYYGLPWNASVGAFGVFQSGHAWEAWAHQPYSHLTSSTSDTNRYAEPAGSRNTDDHYQVDLNYTQNFPIAGYNLQLIADVFNVTDNQTGYNPQPSLNSSLFGVDRSFYAPQRFQLAVRFQF